MNYRLIYMGLAFFAGCHALMTIDPVTPETCDVLEVGECTKYVLVLDGQKPKRIFNMDAEKRFRHSMKKSVSDMSVDSLLVSTKNAERIPLKKIGLLIPN